MLKCGNRIIEPGRFPDKTTQVWMNNIDQDEPELWWWFEDEAELIHLAQVAYQRRQVGNPIERVYIPFFPYARQHKDVDGTFALWPFLRLFSALDIPEVITLDCHTDLSLCGIESRSPDPFIRRAIGISKATVLVYPDAGAADRYGNYSMATIVCEKQRDQRTGKIQGLYTGLESAGLFKDASVLIVDDIVDGGMTFKKAADLAYAYGADEVFAYATHGIFSKGILPLRYANIDCFFTTNSLPRNQHRLEGVSVFDVEPVMKGTNIV